MAARSSTETPGCSQFLPPSSAATPRWFDQSREKRNHCAAQFFCPRAGANPRSSVRRAMAQTEMVSPRRNGPEERAQSKKRKLLPGSTNDSDQANAYGPIIAQHHREDAIQQPWNFRFAQLFKSLERLQEMT